MCKPNSDPLQTAPNLKHGDRDHRDSVARTDPTEQHNPTGLPQDQAGRRRSHGQKQKKWARAEGAAGMGNTEGGRERSYVALEHGGCRGDDPRTGRVRGRRGPSAR
jgi:hypothetical protein